MSRYARWLESEKRREVWPETVGRYFDFFQVHLKENCNYTLTKKLREELENAVLNLEVMPSMRALMTAGPALNRCNVAGFNCAYMPVDSPRAFDETMYILMCGTGVGYSVERQFITKLPEVSSHFEDSDTTLVVRDSKSGWARAFKELVSLLYAGQIPKWDLSKLRPAGARLKTFGGRSSGPEPLQDLFRFTVDTFKSAISRKLTSLECHDILCKVGEVVVVGGVRRSALISLSNLTDDRMRHAKSGEWWNNNGQRSLANNSTAYTEKPTVQSFMDEWAAIYGSKSGERGIFNRQAAIKKVLANGRRDGSFQFGTNPCGEIILRPHQFCNLSEVVVRPEDTLESLMRKVRIASILGTFQATLTNFKYLRPVWKRNTEEERLLGVSLTGIMDNIFTSNPENEWDKDNLEKLKQKVVDTNKLFADKLGIEQSTATTCVKPSGCQVKDSMIVTEKGILSLEELGNITGEEWQEHDINVYKHNGKKLKSIKFYRNGYGKTLKIKTKYGSVLECTPNHQYKKFDGASLVWTRADKLNIEDCLPYSVGTYSGGSKIDFLDINYDKLYHNVKKIKTPKSMNEELAWFLGIYCGDGSTHTKGLRIAGDINKKDRLKKAKDIIKNQFNIDGIIYTRKSQGSADLYINSTPLKHWFEKNNLIKNKTKYVEIPKQIRCSSKKIIEEFIDGYWNADGCLNSSGRTYCTISYTMAKQMLNVLRAIGRDCSIREMPPTETSFGTNMRYWIQEKKGRSGQYIKDRFRKNDYIKLDSAGLEHLYPDYIVSIESSENETFDIEVLDEHQYISESFISHNTVAKLVNSRSGIHTGYGRYMLQSIRGDNNDPLTQLLIDEGVRNEPDITSPQNTTVFYFPLQTPESTVLRKDMAALDQLKIWKVYQDHWCEHNPSCTIYVKEDEWISVGCWIWENFDSIAGITFLPYSDHTYKQAPYNEITKEEYTVAVDAFPDSINWSRLSEFEEEDHTVGSQEFACSGGVCEVVDIGLK